MLFKKFQPWRVRHGLRTLRPAGFDTAGLGATVTVATSETGDEMDVKTVLVAVNRKGADGAIYKGDLIFEQGLPVLVIAWHPDRPREVPLVKVPLNPGRLQPAPSSFGADYLYPDPIDDPRKFQ